MNYLFYQIADGVWLIRDPITSPNGFCDFDLFHGLTFAVRPDSWEFR